MKKNRTIRIVEDKNSPITLGDRTTFYLANRTHCRFLFGKHGDEIWKEAKENKEKSEGVYKLTKNGSNKSSYIITRVKDEKKKE